MQPTPTYSRFQAIISAKPGTDPLPAPAQAAQPTQFPRYSYDSWDTQDNRKRKRQSYDTGPRNIGKALQRAMENEVHAVKETVQYKDRQDLIVGLRERFKQGPQVDFHGYYETPDPGVTHKQRIQTITHEIWKATGYRFTVKDHPHIKDGHKTRFWCSQDEAHRSKSSRMAPKPRVLSGGEVMAKTRYPCRSRLLISSRDADTPGQRIITVRMHHHVAHEPYVDSSLPPEVAQTIWESFGWLNGSFAAAGASGSEANLSGPGESVAGPSANGFAGPSSSADHSHHDASDGVGGGGDSDVEGVEKPHPQSQVEANGHVDLHSHSGQAIRDAPVPPHPLPQIPDDPPLAPQVYQQRMHMHISNIRDFCDGLEYQVQFNDFRMLHVLESEGGAFLRLVQECLRTEGRLRSADGPSGASSSGLPDNGHGLNGNMPLAMRPMSANGTDMSALPNQSREGGS